LPDPTDQLPGEGTLLGVTVWAAMSLFVHVTVLFTPKKTVMAPGEKPGFEPALAPTGIDAVTVDCALANGSNVKAPDSSSKAAAPVTSDNLLNSIGRKPECSGRLTFLAGRGN
jgi:hypothetical protein